MSDNARISKVRSGVSVERRQDSEINQSTAFCRIAATLSCH
jgi:hypothetical protein